LILLTLPIASLYGSFLRWILTLAIHSNNYGEGPVGLPPLSEFLDHLKLLFESFPGAFVSIAICGIMLLLHGESPECRPRIRLFVVCALIISLQLITVAKHYNLRYALPAAAMAALANAGAAYVAAASQGTRRLGFAAVMTALLGLGIWHTGRAVWDWYEKPYAIAREGKSLMAKAAMSGCTFIAYYGASSQEFNLFFGNRLAKGIYSRHLAAIYPDFLSYDSGRFEDFIDVLNPAEAERRLSAKKCIYLFGSPLERFNNFGIASSDLTPIARSQGGPGEALAIYQLSPKVIGQSKLETPR